METKDERQKSKMISALEAYVNGVIDAVFEIVDELERDRCQLPPIGGGRPLAGSGMDSFLTITDVVPGHEISVDLDVIDCYMDIDIPNEFGRYGRIDFQPTMNTKKDAINLIAAIVLYHEGQTKWDAQAIKRVKEFWKGLRNYEDRPRDYATAELQDLLSACGEPGLNHCDGVQKVLEYYSARLFSPPFFATPFQWCQEDSDQLKLLGTMLKIKKGQRG